MKNNLTNSNATTLLAICLLLPAVAPVQAESQITGQTQEQTGQNYQIPAGSLTSVLNRFALEAGVSVLFDPAITKNRTSTGLQGEYRIGEGFSLLLRGTGLSFRIENNGQQVTVYDPAASLIEAPVGTLMLDTMQVVAQSGSRSQIYERADGTSIIGRTEMDRTGPRHASEILQSTAGVYTATNEQNPSVSVNIRGLKDFGRVNMNIDGMRQNFQRSGHGQRNGEMFFDTEFLSEVEVQKGAYAGAGGAGASGGVATFKTLEADDIIATDKTSGGRLRLASGVGKWANGQNPSGSLVLAFRPTDRTDVLIGYSRKDSDQYEPGTQGDAVYWGQNDYYINTGIVNGTGQEMESWIAKANWHITDDLILKASAISTTTRYGESSAIDTDQASTYKEYQKYCDTDSDYYGQYPDFCASYSYDSEGIYPITSTNDTDTQSYALDLYYNPDSHWINAQAKLYQVSTHNISQDSDDSYSVTTHTDTLGGLLSNRSEWSSGHTHLMLDYGIEVFQDRNRPDADSEVLSDNDVDLLAGSTPEGKRQLTGLWLSSNWQYRRLTLTPAIRWETYRLWGNTGFYDSDARADSEIYGEQLWQYADIDVDRSDNRWLPSLGLAYDLIQDPSNQLQLFASGGLSWRPPQITETLTASTQPSHVTAVNTYPNWMLEPEETRSWELGFNWQLTSQKNPQNTLSVKLLHYYNRTENYIIYGTGTATPGFVGTPFYAYSSMYVNALNDLIYEGEELQLDFTFYNFYGGLNLTRTERGYTRFNDHEDWGLLYNAWALGGPDGEDPSSYCPDYVNEDCIAAGTLYFPPEPEWTGKITLGARLLDNTLDIGMTLTGATQTGQYGSLWGTLDGTEDVAGEKIGLRPYTVLDAYGSYQLSEALQLGFNLKNITDREYIQAMGDGMVLTYAPGRTLTANLQWGF
ncbi:MULTISPECIES: TonB-dependent receptor [unclassified Oceanobacter]|uniref:TonB-dependent receptor n=1 Tax=unclassified Oceanobacter TaxID=2620260 RepID=UPI0027347A56|nr:MULTISPECIES: TonB-dependent receptor [unclassified Oceanobacter]MDP2609217.1 TonB-dependent receptor [Oceanobacter sp. 1_MG-2023]MDP2612491.1 TonB-dependent receptor [Oceanobacter sp. 2_MG-2023]